MAQTPEAKVKAKTRALLTAHGAYFHSTISSGYGKSGAPDILACVYGFFVGVECKAGNNPATPLQIAALEQIKAAGGLGLVINEKTLPLLAKILEAVKQRKLRRALARKAFQAIINSSSHGQAKRIARQASEE